MPPVGDSVQVADWAAEKMYNGIIFLGVGVPEIGNPHGIFPLAFERIIGTGLSNLPLAGKQ